MTECLKRLGYLINMALVSREEPAGLSDSGESRCPQFFVPWALVLCNGEGEKGFQQLLVAHG